MYAPEVVSRSLEYYSENINLKKKIEIYQNIFSSIQDELNKQNPSLEEIRNCLKKIPPNQW